MLVQFLAAFDDTVIRRYNKDRTVTEKVGVRYVLAGKQRVMYDIINTAQNITLPVVAVDLTSVEYDKTRVYHKIENVYLPKSRSEHSGYVAKVPPPIPVNLTIKFSIICRYRSDLDQIISNFVPYTNPYIIISWLLPEAYQAEYSNELRSEVRWDGSINIETPAETTYTDKFRCVGDTSFVIKGWLFRAEDDPQGVIYKIDTHFHALDMANKIYSLDDYVSLSAYDSSDRDFTDTITVSGIPVFTNIFYSTSGRILRIREEVPIDKNYDNSFIIYGKNLNYSNRLYLSSNISEAYKNFIKITTAKSPTISAYELDRSMYTIHDANTMSIFLPASTLSAVGSYTFISANSAGWDTSYSAIRNYI